VTPLVTYNIAAISGTIINGSADQTFAGVEETAGGSTVSGSATPLATYNITATSGTIVSGVGTIAVIRGIPVSGGSTISGNGIVSVSHNISISGGINVTGNATQDAVQVEFMQGGVLANGNTFISCIYTSPISGGIIVSGVSIQEYNEQMSGGTKTAGNFVIKFTYNASLSGGIKVTGEAEQFFDDSEQGTGGLVVNIQSANIQVNYSAIVSGGLLANGSARSYQNVSVSGGSLVGGTYAGAFKFISGGGELIFSGKADSDFGYRWIPSNRRSRIYTGGSANVRTNTYRFVASGRINIESDNIYQLSYYDEPCPTTDGFTYVLKYPNNHLECAQEGVYYTQCDVYNRPYKCQNASNAVLSAITNARQQGHLPPRDRTRKFPKVR
jgi:hypothetical protein